MSYERLAQRLIETQESMLGRRAINVAKSVSGLTVDDDGSVSDIDGGDDHDRAVIASLVDEYVSIMGESAHNRLDDAADDFADDLVLPENLGGPADLADADSEPVDAVAETDTGSADATATGDTDVADASSAAATEPASATDDGRPASESGADAGGSGTDTDDGYEPADPEDVVTNIWGEEHESEAETTDADPTQVDIESVYITVTDEGGWEQPVPVRRAIIEAVTNVTDLTEEDLADLPEYVDTHRIVRLLETDSTDPVSFEIEGHDVTLHADGGIHVQ